MRLPRFLLAASAILLMPSPAFAWWEYGHETVAEIAMSQVQPRTRASIAWLLKHQAALETPTCPARTIEEASVWPDCVKTLGDRFSYQYSWHYQDPEICRPFDLTPFCKDGNCVSKQIERNQRLVADRSLPVRDRVMALAYLVHFVGDLHQPLHGGEHDGDQGGNKPKVRYGNLPPRPLHSIWDGLLAERAISTPQGGAAGILSEVPVAERPVLARGSVEDWSRESWQAARDLVYATAQADPCAPADPNAHLDEATIERLVPQVRRQVAKGGLRLARLLDEALDGNHPEVAHPPRIRG
nr:S1/P1 nuclease [uncultured Sphingomonas sp.]